MATREPRFVPLLGALFVALVAVGYLVAGDAPSHHAEGAEIRADYDSEPTHQIAAFLGALAAVPLLFFAGYFRAVLRRLHPSGRLSANVALAAAAVVAAGLTVQSLIHAALAEAAQTSEFSDQALQALNALDGWSLYPIASGFRPCSWTAAWRSCEVVASSRRSLPGLPSCSACWRSCRSSASSPRCSRGSGLSSSA
jgi:hypothetical protein